MSYNGSGTFQINTSGQPVVTGTVISSSAFNALTADLATGLSTAITKDGQTATTVRIPFAQGINSSLATDTTSGSTGSIYTAGGVGITKGLFVGGTATFSATPVFSALTASSAVATDASKNLVSVTNTGTGNNVLATSPTLVTPALGTPSALVGTNITGTAASFNINGTVGATTPAAGSFTSVTNSGLTTGRVVYTSTGGLETSSANLLYSGTDLTVYGVRVGRGAGADSTSTAVGASALAANSTGNSLVAVGYEALNANTSGYSNVAVGHRALKANTTGFNNTAVGLQALLTATTASENTAVGMNALQSNTGSSNTAVGYGSGSSNTTGANNVVVGYQAGYSNTTASNNTAVGYQAAYSNTTGTNNTAVGYRAAYTGSTANQVTAVGINAANANTADDTTAFGYNALTANSTGTYNTAVGRSALQSNTTGGNNASLGFETLINNTTGGNNAAFGFQSLRANTTASNNTAVGYQSLYANTTGDNNIAIGNTALTANTTGTVNTAVGAAAMRAATTATATTGIGGGALIANTTGSYNTGIGREALNTTTTGNYNTSLGWQAGTVLTTGSNNTYLGYQATASGVAVTGEIVLCTGTTTGKGSNTGYINASGGVYQNNNSTLWSVTSDQRLKKNIVDNNIGLDIINQIQVRNFEYRLPEEITDVPQDQAIQKQGIQLGVIAQELQAVLPECVKTESTGVMTVDADNLTWYLVNAVKELSAQVAQLQSQLKGN